VRDYQRRARMSEVVLATGTCKTMLSESFPLLDTPPSAGGWGCEQGSGNTTYAGQVQTSSEGVIRIAVRNVDAAVNERHIYLVPARGDGETAMRADTDLGTGVRAWICGSDWQPVRNALPANCRVDMTTYASGEFGP
jgi:hypothetical protein